MTFPTNIGWPQIVMLLIVVVSCGLLISMLMSLRTHVEVYTDEYGKRIHHKRHRHFGWGRGLCGLVLLLLVLPLLWGTLLLQSYLGLTGDIPVARVHATPIANIPHLMSVEITLYDSNGHVSSANTYVINGDEWMLQADVIRFHPWLNILGFHSGYKLTRLQGRFDDAGLESRSQHTVITLNGGDDNFFTTAQNMPWASHAVESAYGNSTFLRADGQTYNVVFSQDSLRPIPMK